MTDKVRKFLIATANFVAVTSERPLGRRQKNKWRIRLNRRRENLVAARTRLCDEGYRSRVQAAYSNFESAVLAIAIAEKRCQQEEKTAESAEFDYHFYQGDGYDDARLEAKTASQLRCRAAHEALQTALAELQPSPDTELLGTAYHRWVLACLALERLVRDIGSDSVSVNDLAAAEIRQTAALEAFLATARSC